jgi:hypothetical protein
MKRKKHYRGESVAAAVYDVDETRKALQDVFHIGGVLATEIALDTVSKAHGVNLAPIAGYAFKKAVKKIPVM